MPESIILADALSRTCIAVVWLLPLLVLPKLRDVGSFHLPGTWTVFLVLPLCLINLIFFGRLPKGLPWSFHVCFIWGGMAAGFYEELVFRGYAFRRSPENHPRLVIVTSAVCFALMHLVNLTHAPLGSVLFFLPATLVMGLGLGIIRIVTGSLAWCILLHGATDVAVQFSRTGENWQKTLPFVVGICGVASVATLYMHPKLRSRSHGNYETLIVPP